MKKTIVILTLLVLSACKSTPTSPDNNQLESKAVTSSSTSTPDNSVNEVVTLSKPQSANLKIKSKVNSTIVYVDDSSWKFEKILKENTNAEYNFTLENTAVSGRLVTEKIALNPKILTQAALFNMRKVDPNAKVVKQEKRKINGNDVIYMEMLSSAKGLEFKLFGVYHSNESGSTQLVVFTLKDLEKDYNEQIQGLLAGFDVVKK